MESVNSSRVDSVSAEGRSTGALFLLLFKQKGDSVTSPGLFQILNDQVD